MNIHEVLRIQYESSLADERAKVLPNAVHINLLQRFIRREDAIIAELPRVPSLRNVVAKGALTAWNVHRNVYRDICVLGRSTLHGNVKDGSDVLARLRDSRWPAKMLLNFADYQAMTPMHFACMQDAPSAAIKLMELGARWYAKDDEKQTPMDIARFYKRGKTVDEIEAHAARIILRAVRAYVLNKARVRTLLLCLGRTDIKVDTDVAIIIFRKVVGL